MQKPMSAGVIARMTADIVDHMDATYAASEVDDAAKRAALELAAKTFDVKITREMTVAGMQLAMQKLMG